jgi:hypothetical protein
MDSRTIQGNSPWLALVPPTTFGVAVGPGDASAGASIRVTASAAPAATTTTDLRILFKRMRNQPPAGKEPGIGDEDG